MDLPSTLDLACGSWTQQPLTQDPLKPDSEESIRWHNEAFSLSGCFLATYTTVPLGSKLWPLLKNHLPGRWAARRPESPGSHVRCQLGHDCQFSMCLTQQCREACDRPGPRPIHRPPDSEPKVLRLTTPGQVPYCYRRPLRAAF